MSTLTIGEVDGDGAVVTVNGIELFVRRFGDPTRPPLVLIHGGPTWDHSYLLSAATHLTDVAHVVLFDLPGCGRSHRIAPHGDLPENRLQPESLADDIAALIHDLGTPTVDVLGFSYGGRLAMRLVERHPHLVRKLVLASTCAYTDFDHELHALDDYRQRAPLCTAVSFDDPILSGPNAPDGALSRAMAHGDAPLQIWRLDRLDAWQRVLDQVRFTSDYNQLYATGALHPAAADNAEQILRAWSRPILILHGVHDTGFPITVARRLHTALPASALAEIPDAGHMAHFDNPTSWVTAIHQFLLA